MLVRKSKSKPISPLLKKNICLMGHVSWKLPNLSTFLLHLPLKRKTGEEEKSGELEVNVEGDEGVEGGEVD